MPNENAIYWPTGKFQQPNFDNYSPQTGDVVPDAGFFYLKPDGSGFYELPDSTDLYIQQEAP